MRKNGMLVINLQMKPRQAAVWHQIRVKAENLRRSKTHSTEGYQKAECPGR